MSHLYPLKINNEKGSQYYNVFYQFICSVANDAAVKCLSYSSETSPTVMFSMQNIRKPLAYSNGHLSIYRLSPPDSITTVRKLHSCLWLDGWLLKFEAQCFHFAVTYMCSVGFWKGYPCMYTSRVLKALLTRTHMHESFTGWESVYLKDI